MSTNPSARGSLRLDAGRSSAVIDLEHGGRLASLRIDDRELLVGPPVPRDGSIGWGCFLMAPWPGRLANARLQWRGRTIQLPRNHGRHAIHGLLYGVPWTVAAKTKTEARLSVELGSVGWPFGGRVRQRIALEPRRLVLEAEVDADRPMPAALGWHPWFDRRGADPRVRVEADRVLVTSDMIPTGQRIPVRGLTDLRTGPQLGRRRLDHVYTEAQSPAVISWPDLELRLEFEPPLTTVVVHTPQRGFCVEPQTAWPNDLGVPARRAAAAHRADLEPGGSLAARLALVWSLPPG